jgi:hypothetical protein
MILLGLSAKLSFKKIFANKKGSAILEATMVMPLTCLILVTLVGIIMTFHGNFAKQVNSHKKEILERECHKELLKIRLYDRFIDWIEE